MIYGEYIAADKKFSDIRISVPVHNAESELRSIEKRFGIKKGEFKVRLQDQKASWAPISRNG